MSEIRCRLHLEALHPLPICEIYRLGVVALRVLAANVETEIGALHEEFPRFESFLFAVRRYIGQSLVESGKVGELKRECAILEIGDFEVRLHACSDRDNASDGARIAEVSEAFAEETIKWTKFSLEYSPGGRVGTYEMMGLL